MKKVLLSLALFIGGAVGVSFGQDCSGNRYYQPIFQDVVKVSDVVYGSNLPQTGTTPMELKVDIYYPDGDTDTQRPLVLLAHGGSFMGGSKADLETQCRAFASMGYVAASMQYRLLSLNAQVIMNPGPEFKQEVVRAIHDMRAAIRFFRRSVSENGNPYGIHPDLILVGGVSAGAILANHVTYLDSENKIPSDLVSYIADQGGLEGNSGNPGYSSVPQMAISWCGAIMDTTWLEPGDQPYVGMHNLGDGVVPNMYGQPNVGMTIPVDLYGDSLMYKRTLNIGVPGRYKSYPGNGHCDFPNGSESLIIDFMHEQLCETGLLATAMTEKEIIFSVYPNPASESFFVDLPANSKEWEVSIISLLGQVMDVKTMSSTESRVEFNSSNYNAGIYLVNMKSADGKTAVKKVVVQ